MTFPNWIKPGAYGALGGAVAVILIGFNWGGWTTAGKTQDIAQALAEETVAMAMVPVCLSASAADPERAAKLAILQETPSYNRSRAMMDTGWATFPGTDTPNRELAAACVEGLELDGS